MHQGSYYDNIFAKEMKKTQVFFSLRCSFLCMTSLAVRLSMLKTSVKFWGTSFKLWLCPCPYLLLSNTYFHVLIDKACCVLKLFPYPHKSKIYIFKIYKFKLQTRIFKTKWVMLCLFWERAHSKKCTINYFCNKCCGEHSISLCLQKSENSEARAYQNNRRNDVKVIDLLTENSKGVLTHI